MAMSTDVHGHARCLQIIAGLIAIYVAGFLLFVATLPDAADARR